MTLTISDLSFTRAIGKTGTANGLMTSRAKIYSVSVTFGSSDNYVTGGVDADLKLHGVRDLIFVSPEFNDAGLVVQYDKVNEKIMLYGQTPTDTPTPVEALKELGNGSTITHSKTFTFLVIGT